MQGRCKSATTAESQSCHARCESLRATYAAVDTDQDGRCKNTPAVRRQLLGCLSAECNQVEPCTAQTDVSCAQ